MTFDVVLKGGDPHYPVPWARTPATSFLLTAAATRAAIEPAGFRTLTWQDDTEAAKTFYGSVFGFHFDEIPDMGGYATFATDERPLGGLGPVQPDLPKGWSACFGVSSTGGTAAAVEAAGGKALLAAQDSPYGRFAVLEDPWGASFSVIEVRPEG